jgi:FtsZ-binding cell division protein ZapB
VFGTEFEPEVKEEYVKQIKLLQNEINHLRSKNDHQLNSFRKQSGKKIVENQQFIK